MKLRAWLTLATAATGIAVFAGAWAGFGYYRDFTRREILVQSTLSYMTAESRAECEKNAASWMPEPARTAPGKDWVNGRRPPMRRRLFAYDSAFVSANVNAPEIDSDMMKAAAAGQIAWKSWTGVSRMGPPWRKDGPGGGDLRPDLERDAGEPGAPPDQPLVRLGRILVPMPWKTGPCANVLVEYEEPPESAGPGGFTPPTVVWIIPVLFMIIAVLVAAGPVVGRIRRLTRMVRQSALAGYEKPIFLKGSDEIAELGAAFETARTEILGRIALQERREQNLREFLENTTHDISIPLTVLQGRLADLAGDAERGGADPDKVGGAISEAQYIAALIGNLAVASRIQTGQPEPQKEPVDMCAVVQRCVARHRPIARQARVTLEHAVPEHVVFARGDVTFIEQAVNNLVFNAIRHNRPGGHVAVILEEPGNGLPMSANRQGAVETMPRETPPASICVIDDGPGIPEEELSRLAERYYRAGRDRGRNAGGQGIGLHIASTVAAIHGWRFSLSKSEYGGLLARLEFEMDGPDDRPDDDPVIKRDNQKTDAGVH
ncbi:MAG TPA: HAMP domain-containing sensor histidine kinase [Myxococcota bacterium]|nr:HAMP domain-containing sensor histidine kinase [Myxococcota bacterium]HOA12854.1 HAMP domain-containing sensor histidine kinase [Myxococcota bacterium]HOC98692.1 HAMP domain-containing sensor histidine kinase [Myxococcota bacterium]HOH76558.1 HAMP domain-containing sensor histidine kinase [Myxococcota bacterium]HPV04587.1 HAMP domain-containing sensor histidine kinase [Myxococcota bacterium]